MTPTDGSLYHALAQVPDHRHPRGQSYPLAALLTFAATAMLCGAKSLYAIAQWGRDYNHLAPLLGLTRARPGGGFRTPCVSELHTVFARLAVARFEAARTGWVRAAGFDDLDERVVHLDGKRLRGSHGHQLPGVHLLAVYSGELGAVVAQLAVVDTNEHTAALELLGVIPLGGVIRTGDAAFTPRDVCEAVTADGGHYLLPVKDNQPTRKADIAAGFARSFSPGRAGRPAGHRPGGRDPGEGARAGRAAADPDDHPIERVPGVAGGPAGVRGRADPAGEWDRDDRGDVLHHQPATDGGEPDPTPPADSGALADREPGARRPGCVGR